MHIPRSRHPEFLRPLVCCGRFYRRNATADQLSVIHGMHDEIEALKSRHTTFQHEYSTCACVSCVVAVQCGVFFASTTPHACSQYSLFVYVRGAQTRHGMMLYR
jgi:hypothetical protein